MTNRVVLLVAAEQGFAAHATTVLTGGGYVVLIARTVHDALETVARLSPDVVLVDARGVVASADGRGWPELVRRTAHTGTRGFVLVAATADASPALAAPEWARLVWDPAATDLSAMLSRALDGHGSPRAISLAIGGRETAPPQ